MNPNVYKRPNKPNRVIVTRRQRTAASSGVEVPEALEVHRSTECHVTPPAVARRMVGYLGPVGNFLTLEPSAGTGSLLIALLESGHSIHETVAIEFEASLCKSIRQRMSKAGQELDPLNECFLAYAERTKGGIEYPRILMNPPFRKTKQHIEAALSLLGKGGHGCATLVALVPVTYDHLDAETVETLGPDTFPAAKVHTKIIRFFR